jgi:hypothetical protein
VVNWLKLTVSPGGQGGGEEFLQSTVGRGSG